jgi:hypothetical protein
MPLLRLSTRLLLSTALMVFVLGALWLTALPETLRVSTYVSIAVLLTALTALAMKTHAGGRATSGVGALLHRGHRPGREARHGGSGLPAVRIP